MSTPLERLRRAGWELPPAPQPKGSYVSAKRHGDLLHLSAHGPFGPDGGFTHIGQVGGCLSVAEGRAAAAATALSLLATAATTLRVDCDAAGGSPSVRSGGDANRGISGERNADSGGEGGSDGGGEGDSGRHGGDGDSNGRDGGDGLSAISGVLRLTGYVNATAGFADHAAVLDGASEVLEVAFGPDGRAARSVVGVASLPFDLPIVTEATFVIRAGHD